MKTSLTVTLILTILYGALISLFNFGAETAAQRYLRKNRNAVASYSVKKPQLVLAGSSLTAALSLSDFGGCTYNLGLIGESSLTGLDVIISSDWKPSMVFVEVNFPERESNLTLTYSDEGWLARYFPNIIYVTPINNLVQIVAGALQRLRAVPVSIDSNITSSGFTEADKAREAELKIQREFFEKKAFAASFEIQAS